MRRTLLLVPILLIAGAFTPKPLREIRSVTKVIQPQLIHKNSRSPATVAGSSQTAVLRAENPAELEMTDEQVRIDLSRASRAAESIAESRALCKAGDRASCAVFGHDVIMDCDSLEAKHSVLCAEGLEISLMSCRQGYSGNCRDLLIVYRERADVRAELLEVNKKSCAQGRVSFCQNYEDSLRLEAVILEKGSPEERAFASLYAETTYDHCTKEHEGSCISFLTMTDVPLADGRVQEAKAIVRETCDRNASDLSCVDYARYLTRKENDRHAGLKFADRSCEAGEGFACFESVQISYDESNPRFAKDLMPRLHRFCEPKTVFGVDVDKLCDIYKSSLSAGNGSWESIRYQEIAPARGDEPALTVEEFFSK